MWLLTSPIINCFSIVRGTSTDKHLVLCVCVCVRDSPGRRGHSAGPVGPRAAAWGLWCRASNSPAWMNCTECGRSPQCRGWSVNSRDTSHVTLRLWRTASSTVAVYSDWNENLMTTGLIKYPKKMFFWLSEQLFNSPLVLLIYMSETTALVFGCAVFTDKWSAARQNHSSSGSAVRHHLWPAAQIRLFF